jgi:hypothetical protein
MSIVRNNIVSAWHCKIETTQFLNDPARKETYDIARTFEDEGSRIPVVVAVCPRFLELPSTPIHIQYSIPIRN